MKRILVFALLLICFSPMALAVKQTDGFEDNDFSNDPFWEETTSQGSASVQQSVVQNGQEALLVETTTGNFNDHVLNHDRGSNDSVIDGDVYQTWIQTNDTSSVQYWGYSNTKGQLDTANDAVQLYIDGGSFKYRTRDGSGNILQDQSFGSPSDNTWYRFEIELFPSQSEADFRVYDDQDTLLHNKTGISTTGASNLQHAVIRNTDSKASKLYIDDVSYSNKTVSITSNFTVEAQDSFDQSTIQNFSANLTGQTTGTTYDLNTTNGTITTPVLFNSSELWDVNVSSHGYFDRDYKNVNVSQNTTLTASLDDNRSKFTEALTKVSNTSQTKFNITIQNQTFQSNTTFASPDTYNATYTKQGWYNKTQSFNASLNNEFTDVFDHKASFTVEDQVTNNTIDNHTIQLSRSDYQETKNTTNGTTTFNIIQNKTYNVTITGDSVATKNTTYNATNNKSNNQTFKAFTTRSALINVLETQDRSKITNDVRIRLQSINLDREVQQTKVISDGDAYFTLLEPARYRAQLNSSSYTDNQFYFQVREDQSAEYEFYLAKNDTTAPVTFTVIDQSTNTLENVKVSIQRFYNETRTYETITEEITNLEGQATLSPPNDNEYYQITFTRDEETLRVTEPLRLLDNSYQIQVETTGDFLEDAETVTSVEQTLTYNNDTENFKATYNQQGQQNKVCLRVTKQYTTQPSIEVDEQCTTTSTGTILIQRSQENTTQRAVLTYETNDNKYTLKSITRSFNDPIPRGTTGVFAQIILSLFFAAASLAITPSAALTALPISLYVGWWIGLINIPVTTITGLLVAGVTATYAVTKGGIR